MVSRYFTMKEGGHFPNNCACIEVTPDGKYIHHYDDGTTKVSDQLKAPALHACMQYVRAGQWVEISEVPAPRDQPSTLRDEVW
jgi:hypothetical protein